MDGFFGIGFGELVMIAIVALIVLGPERLPSALREVAKFIRQVRNLSQEFTSQFGDDFKALEDLNPRRLLQEAIDNIDEEENAKDGKAKTPAKKSTTPTTAAKKTTTTPAKPAAAKNGVAKSTTASKTTSATTSTTTGTATKSTETTPIATTKSDDTELAAAETTSANEDKSTVISEKAEMSEKPEAVEPKVEATSGIEVDVAASNSAPTTAQPMDEPENRIAPPDSAEHSAPQVSVAETNQSSLVEPSQEVVQTNGHAGPNIDSGSRTVSVASTSAPENEPVQASTITVSTEPTVEYNGQLENEEMRS